jgi:hypothetical protein
MIRRFSLLILFGLLAGNAAWSRAQYAISLEERMLSQIKEPILHVYTSLVQALATPYPQDYPATYYGMTPAIDLLAPLPDIPEFRKYQNRHIAPTRIYVGAAAIATGGVMMFAGYRQDTKYEWSGPYMSTSPLNVFGMVIIAIGLCFIASGLIFYSKFKKHTIQPYNKSY